MEESWPKVGDRRVEVKWNALQNALKVAADRFERKKKRDWYSGDTIKPALKKRNECYQQWLTTGRIIKECALARHKAREAKSAWFRSEAEGRFSGKKQSKYIRDDVVM